MTDFSTFPNLLLKTEVLKILKTDIQDIDLLLQLGLLKQIRINTGGATRITKESILELVKKDYKQIIKEKGKKNILQKIDSLQNERDEFISSLNNRFIGFDSEWFEEPEGFVDFVQIVFKILPVQAIYEIKHFHKGGKIALKTSITNTQIYFDFNDYVANTLNLKNLIDLINKILEQYSKLEKLYELFYTQDQLINVALLSSQEKDNANKLGLLVN